MSTTIDQKIVEMRFDNAQFERNVQQSIDSTAKLKESLDFNGVGESMSEITKNAKKVDLSAISEGLNKLESHFSATGIAFMTVMSRMTNAAIDAGLSITKALTITPMKTGFEEYELKMGSVQTIMAATGESIENVNEYLEELNKYSDQTIYSFSDMTNNIGKFTNAGVKLEDAVAAIKGISNEAAISGANAAEASRAMYNFAQALSSGYVKLIDWKSIENANMATKEFKQQLIDTAVELGTVVKVGEKYQTTTKDNQGKVSDLFDATSKFNDALSNQWMTTDVLTKTLHKYSDATTDIGKRAFAAAQDVKTFSMMVDTLKEAMQSGWAITSELIFGNLEQAKILWTNIANALSEVIERVDDFRNGILKSANEVVYDDDSVIMQYKKQLEALAKVVTNKPLKLADWKSIQNAGMATEKFRDALMEAAWEAGDLKKNADGMYETIITDGNGKEIHQVIQNADDFAKSLESGWLNMEHIQKVMKTNASGIFGMEAFGDTVFGLRDNLISGFANIASVIGTFVDVIAQAFNDIFAGPNGDIIEHFSTIIRDLSNRFRLFTETLLDNKEVMGNIYSIFVAVFTVLKLGINLITAAFKIVKGIFDIIKPGVKIILDVVSVTALLVAALASAIIQSETIQDVAGFIAGVLSRIGKLIGAIYNRIKNSKVFVKALGAIAKLVSSIANALSKIKFPSFKSILDWMDELIDKVSTFSLEDAFNDWFSFDFSNGFSSFFDNIKKAFSNFFSGLQNGVKSAIGKVAGLLTNTVFPTFKSGVIKFFNGIDEFLSLIHWERILNVAKIAFIATSIANVVSIFLSLVRTINTFTDAARALANAGIALIEAYTSKIRSEAFSEMLNNVQKLARIVIELGILSVIIASLPEETYRRAVLMLEHLIVLVSICVGAVMTIYFLMKSIQTFSARQPITDIATAIAAVGKSFATGFTKAVTIWAKNKSIQGVIESVAVTILAIAGALVLLNDAFANMDPNQINGLTIYLQALIPTFAVVAALIAEVTIAAKVLQTRDMRDLQTLSLSMVAIIGAMSLLAVSMGYLTLNDADKIKAGADAMGSIMTGVLLFAGIVAIVASKVDDDDFARKITLFAGFVVGVSLAMGVLASALYVLSNQDVKGLESATNALILTMGALVAGMVILLAVFNRLLDGFGRANNVMEQLADVAAIGGLGVLLIGFAGAILIVSVAIKELSTTVNAGNLSAALALLTSIFAAILAFVAVVGFMMQKFDLSDNLMKMAISIGGFTLAIMAFSKFDVPSLAKGVLAITGLMLGVATAVRIAGGNESVKGINKFSFAVTALAAGVWILSKIPFAKAITSIIEAAVLMYTFSKITQTASGLKVAPLIALFGGLIVFVGTLAYLGQISSTKDIKMVYGYVGALMLLIGSLSILTRAVGKSGLDVKGLLGMGAILGGFALLMGAVAGAAAIANKFPGGLGSLMPIIAITMFLSTWLIALGTLISVFFSYNVSSISTMFSTIGLMLGSLGVLIVAIAAAGKLADGHIETIYALIPVMVALEALSVGTAYLLARNNFNNINDFKSMMKSLAFLITSLTGLIAVVAGVSYLIGDNTAILKTMWQITGMISIFGFMMGYVVKSISDLDAINSKTLALLGIILFQFIGALAAIVTATKFAQDYKIDPTLMGKLVLGAVAALGSIILFDKQLAKIDPPDKSQRKAFLEVALTMGFVMSTLAGVSILVSKFADPKSFAAVVLSAITLFGAITLFVTAIKKNIVVGGFIHDVQREIKIIAGLALAIAGTMAVIAGASALVHNLSSIKTFAGSLGTMVIFFYALIPMLEALTWIGKSLKTGWKDALIGLGGVEAVALAIGATIFALSKIIPQGIDLSNMAGSLKIVTVLFYALIPLLVCLAFVGAAIVETGGLAALTGGMGLVAVVALALGISAVIRAMDLIIPKGVDVGYLAGVLKVTTIFFYALVPLLAAITVVGALMMLAGGVSTIAGMVAMGALALEVGVLIRILSSLATGVDMGAIIAFCATAVIFVSSFTVLLGVITVAGFLAIPATLSAVALAGTIAIIALLFAGLANLKPLLKKGYDVLSSLADGIAKIFEKVSGHLGPIGTNIAEFGKNLKPFFDTVEGLDDKVLNGVKTMADAMWELTKVAWANIIGISWIGVLNAAGQMVLFASSMDEFSEAVSNIKNWEAMEKATECIANICTAAHNVPNTGGLVSWFTGDNDLDKFGEMLSKFGKHLVIFHQQVGFVSDWTPVSSAVTAMNDIFEAAHNIPNSGPSVVSFFVGDNDIAEFGRKLSNFGKHLVTFYSEVAGITDWTPTQLAVIAMRDIFDAAKEVPKDANSIIGKITGMSDIGEFATKLSSFATAMTFFNGIELNIANIQNSLDAMTVVFGKTKYIDKTDSALFKMTPKDFEIMSMNAESMCNMLKTLATSLTITPQEVNNIKNATRTFAEFFNLNFNLDAYLAGTKTDVKNHAEAIVEAFKKAIGVEVGESVIMQNANIDFWNGWFHTNEDNAATAALIAYKDGLDVVAAFRNGIDAHSDARSMIQAVIDFWNGWIHKNDNLASKSKEIAKQDGKDISEEFVKGTESVDASSNSVMLQTLDQFNSKDAMQQANESGMNVAVAYTNGVLENTYGTPIESKLVTDMQTAGEAAAEEAAMQGAIAGQAYKDAFDANSFIASEKAEGERRKQRGASFHEGQRIPASQIQAEYMRQKETGFKSTSALPSVKISSQAEHERQKGIKAIAKKDQATYADQLKKRGGIAYDEYLKANRTKEQKDIASKLAADTVGASKDVKKATSNLSNIIDAYNTAKSNFLSGKGSWEDVQNVIDEAKSLKNTFAEGTLGKGFLNLKNMGIDIGEIKEAVGIDTNLSDMLGLNDLADSSDEAAEKVKDNVKTISDAFNDYWSSLKSKRDSFANEGGLFSAVDWGFDPENPVTKETLKKNLEDQIAQLSRFQNVQAELAGRITNDGLRYAIQEMGVDQLEELEALSTMTADELSAYEKLYETKMEKATATADIVSQKSRDELAGKLNATLGTSFNNLDSNEAVSQLESFWDGTEAGLKALIEADAAGIGHSLSTELAAGMMDEESMKVYRETLGKGVSEAIANGMTSDEAIQTLKDAGYVISADTEKYLREGIVDGIGDEESMKLYRDTLGKGVSEGIAAGMTCDEAIQTLKDAGYAVSDDTEKYLREAFDINSPSKLIRDNVGQYVLDAVLPTDELAYMSIRDAAISITSWMLEAFKEQMLAYQAIGEMMDIGIAQGINSGVYNIQDAISNMGTLISSASKSLESQDITPTIRPVYTSKALDEYNSMMNSLNAQRSSMLANQANASMETNVNKTITIDNHKAVDAITKLNNDLLALGDRISGLQVMLDSGALVGQIAPQMNSALGMTALRTARVGG